MCKKLKEEINEYYNERAKEYEDFLIFGGNPASIFDPESYQSEAKNISSLLSRFIEGKIVDIACGTGYWLPSYAQNCPEITLIDQSQKMLDECTKKIESLGIEKKCKLILDDFFAYEFKEKEFDVALEKCDSNIDQIGSDPRAAAIIYNSKGGLYMAQGNKFAAEKAPWGSSPPEGLYRGIAAHDFHETMLAFVVEISVDENQGIRVHRVICALDCGIVINPKIVEAQIRGGIAFGLTAALKSEITIRKSRVVQSNFDDFPLLRMDEMPVVEVHIVPSTNPPHGIGETAVPLIGPAVANAVYAATGQRIRKLPIYPHDLQVD